MLQYASQREPCDRCGEPMFTETGFVHICNGLFSPVDEQEEKELSRSRFWTGFLIGAIIGWFLTDLF
ncbi:MAG: hypothetical protein ACP5O7_12545 [Phycisphaerae bacterium]